MKLSQIKALLPTLDSVSFKLEDGTSVPPHFHITEIGKHSKQFIDCGGTVREEQWISFQLWSSVDVDHRLLPDKLLQIILMSESKLQLENGEIEVEYQSNTIGKYSLLFDGQEFILKAKMTECLASDHCGIPNKKPIVRLSEIGLSSTNACSPKNGCCS